MNTLIPIVLSTLLYLWVAWGSFRQKDYGHALMWAAYALANVGLLIYYYSKKENPE